MDSELKAKASISSNLTTSLNTETRRSATLQAEVTKLNGLLAQNETEARSDMTVIKMDIEN